MDSHLILFVATSSSNSSSVVGGPVESTSVMSARREKIHS